MTLPIPLCAPLPHQPEQGLPDLLVRDNSIWFVETSGKKILRKGNSDLIDEHCSCSEKEAFELPKKNSIHNMDLR